MSEHDTPQPYSWGTREAAEFYGVTQKQIKVWARDGKIPATRTPGGHWRFSAAELAEHAAARRNG